MSKAQHYVSSREAFRKRAQHDFLCFHAHANDLIVSTNELVASLTLSISGESFTGAKGGPYVSDLMASFCRSHFIACDLIVGGELIEADVLIRKQMELLARLNEISSGFDLDKLEKRTPNVRHLKTALKKLYGDYSEIAHSASPKVMQILGGTKSENGTYTLLYPEFRENAYVSMQHLVMTALEYYVWCSSYLVENVPAYDPDIDGVLFDIAFKMHQRVYESGDVELNGT